MSGDRPRLGMLDTNIVILRKWVDPSELPEEMAISAITLAELSAGAHEVRGNDEQDAYDEHAERAQRLEILQGAENEFDPVPFDAEAARLFGRVYCCSHRSRSQAPAKASRPYDRGDGNRRGPAVVHHYP
jgi:predicted nucleic acid-binding protein